MPLDREETLRRAEKLLREGKIDPAIAEYRAVVDELPSDWSTANLLGDLYVRAGRLDNAVAEFTRIAGHLGGEGFLSKAIALHKKILKIKPDEETSMLQLGDLSARQGLMVESRAYYVTLIERLKARGDTSAEAFVRARFDDLEAAAARAKAKAAEAAQVLADTWKEQPAAEPVAVEAEAQQPPAPEPSAPEAATLESTAAEPEPAKLELAAPDRAEPEPVAPERPPAQRLESVLKGLRDEAIHDASPETAEQYFKLAATYMEIGMPSEAIGALQVAARSPAHAFRAGAMLGKAYLNTGDANKAIEWYGRAVESPAPAPEAHYALLYEFATVLEANGEGARALAVLLELQSEAGEYRDVASRLEQLKIQTGGAAC